MSDIKKIVAENISSLRTANGLTQTELAEKLNYSDKAVSKWERGESIPDVAVLKQIAEMFDVKLDYLVTSAHSREDVEESNSDLKKRIFSNRGFITGMSVLLVWIVAGLLYVIFNNVPVNHKYLYLLIPYAVDCSLIVWLVFNSIWFKRRRNFLIISLLMWMVLFSVYITLLPVTNLWEISILGVLGQVVIVFWSKLRFK